MHKLGIRRYLVAGVLLLLPLWLTYVVVSFLFTRLAEFTEPLVSRVLDWPDWARYPISALLTVLLIYLLGLFGSWVFGKRLLHAFDLLMERIPLVKAIYGGAKKLLNVMQTSPDQAQRVVLVDFPHQGMKAVGLVTRVLTDTTNGKDYAAVYVPTTPNPTSGFLELVPVDRVEPSDMTMDEAMSFIISGGAINPARFVEKVEETPAPAATPTPAPTATPSQPAAG